MSLSKRIKIMIESGQYAWRGFSVATRQKTLFERYREGIEDGSIRLKSGRVFGNYQTNEQKWYTAYVLSDGRFRRCLMDSFEPEDFDVERFLSDFRLDRNHYGSFALMGFTIQGFLSQAINGEL